MEIFENKKVYMCVKCGTILTNKKFNKEKDILEMHCSECGHIHIMKPMQETAITEVVESDKPILLG
jgi:DNA-directed RNA polymerase subunit RPC12/RpoP